MREVGPSLAIERIERGLALSGEIDAHTAPQFEAAIGQCLEAGMTSITLDMSEVGFMDSSGLRVLLSATETTRDRDGDLDLASPSPPVRKVIEVSGLADHLTIAP